MQISRITQQTVSVDSDLRHTAQPSVPMQEQQGHEPKTNTATKEQLDASFNRLQKKLEDMQDTKVEMNYDKDIDRVIIRYSSRATGEVINQIPTEKFVEFEKEFDKVIGLLFDHKV